MGERPKLDIEELIQFLRDGSMPLSDSRVLDRLKWTAAGRNDFEDTESAVRFLAAVLYRMMVEGQQAPKVCSRCGCTLAPYAATNAHTRIEEHHCKDCAIIDKWIPEELP